MSGRSQRPMSVAMCSVVVGLAALCLVAGHPRSVGATPAVPAIETVISAYLDDPQGNADKLMARASESDAWPPPYRLALADAYLRRGDTSRGRGILESVLASGASPPWSTWADLVLGWVEFASGNFDQARMHYERAGTSDIGGALAPVVGALIDAAQYRHPDAAERLARIADAPENPRPLRALAGLAAGYAWYWTGNFTAAADAFHRCALGFPDSPLTDDAAFAAAWARWRAGDRQTAVGALQALANASTGERLSKRQTQVLLDLEPRALLRAGMKRYARAPVRDPVAHLVALFDDDGGALARVALTSIERRPKAGESAVTAAPGLVDDEASAPAVTPHEQRAAVHIEVPPGANGRPVIIPRAETGGAIVGVSIVLVLGLLAFGAWLVLRERAQPGRRSRL